MRKSVMTYDEAKELVNDFVESAKEEGMNVYVEERSADCEAFPCPRELDGWQGETNAICVYDEDANEEVYAVAYWGVPLEAKLTGREIFARITEQAGDTLCQEITAESIGGMIAALQTLAKKAKEVGGDISDKSFEYADFDDFGAEQYIQPIFDL